MSERDIREFEIVVGCDASGSDLDLVLEVIQTHYDALMSDLCTAYRSSCKDPFIELTVRSPA